MQCLRICFTIWFFAVSVNHSVASPVDISNVDNKNVGDLNIAESNQDDAVVSERDNEVGYLRKEAEKGADAYQHFESFHDKDGDAYGYEKHEAYGKSNKGESLNDEKDKSEGSHYNYVQELGDKPKYQKYHGSIDDPGKSKQSNYHYSYNSDDDDDNDQTSKPNHSSSYIEAKKDDSSEDDSSEEEESDDDGTDEEKSTNFSYKIISDDYEDEDANGDIKSKGSGSGSGYHFGHGDKNTEVDYNPKKSDYTAGEGNDDNDDNDDGNDENDDEGSEEEGEKNVIHKIQKINEDDGKAKNAKSYSTYTTYSSQEGDDDDEEENSDSDNKSIPKHAVRYENSYPIKYNKHSNNKKVVDNDESEESDESDDDDGNVNDDVVLHQSRPEHVQPRRENVQPRPTKPVTLVKEHRAGYAVRNDHPKSTVTKAQVIIQPSKPIVLVQEHHAGYKVEDSDGGKDSSDGNGGKNSDDSGKGHAGSISKHLYEIYVTHDTGKSNGNGGGNGGDSKGSDDAGGDSGNGKSENLVLEQPQKVKNKADGTDNGAYNININYGKKKGLKKNGKNANRKHKGSIKKKKILKPHKYEVEEYIDSEDETKQPIVAGKESSPQHHRDSEDYSSGQQFVFASEADSDAYYF